MTPVRALRELGAHQDEEHQEEKEQMSDSQKADKTTIVALPVAGGALCPHFGHCDAFAMFTVNGGAVVGTKVVPAPPHNPGYLPGWLSQHGVDVVIAGGIGGRAVGLFTELGIDVVSGAPAADAAQIVEAYLDGSLQATGGVCEHHGGHGHSCGH